MKKYSLIIMLLLLGSLIVVADDDIFIQKLKTCANYSSSGNVQVSGIQATSNKSILGMQDGKCAYQEKINMMGINSVISCKFTEPQIKELTTVMEAYNTLQGYSNNEDLSTLEGVSKNPVANAWSKYINNPEVCNISSDALQQ